MKRSMEFIIGRFMALPARKFLNFLFSAGETDKKAKTL
jgi:hypothetical protein